MAAMEFALQFQRANGRWYLGREHYSSRKAAQRDLDQQLASGPYPNGDPQEPRRIVVRRVATRWKPVE